MADSKNKQGGALPFILGIAVGIIVGAALGSVPIGAGLGIVFGGGAAVAARKRST